MSWIISELHYEKTELCCRGPQILGRSVLRGGYSALPIGFLQPHAVDVSCDHGFFQQTCKPAVLDYEHGNFSVIVRKVLRKKKKSCLFQLQGFRWTIRPLKSQIYGSFIKVNGTLFYLTPRFSLL
jgi:hypothetical protein